jgi:transposase
MAAHNIEPAYTPTYSSWLNAIEAHFTSLKKFAIGGTDDPSHEYRRWRIARYLTWRNKEKGSSGPPWLNSHGLGCIGSSFADTP